MTSRLRANNIPYNRPGVVLAELIIALAITAMACAAAAAVLKAVAGVYETNRGISDTVAGCRNAMTRLGVLIRQARLIGYRDSTRLVFWAEDADEDQRISPAELMMVRYNPASQSLELLDYYFPTETPEQDKHSHRQALSLDGFCSRWVADLFDYDSYVRVRTLAEKVRNFSIAADKPCYQARCVRMTFTLDSGEQSQQFHTVIALRSPAYYLLQSLQGGETW